jgi:hypothetical protein
MALADVVFYVVITGVFKFLLLLYSRTLSLYRLRRMYRTTTTQKINEGAGRTVYLFSAPF